MTHRNSNRTGRRASMVGAAMVLLALAALSVVAADAVAQSGNDVGRNLGRLLRGYAGQLYGGVIAIVSVLFLINRRYKDLGLFLIAAIVVGWLVFSPDEIADTARSIARQVLG